MKFYLKSMALFSGLTLSLALIGCGGGDEAAAPAGDVTPPPATSDTGPVGGMEPTPGTPAGGMSTAPGGVVEPGPAGGAIEPVPAAGTETTPPVTTPTDEPKVGDEPAPATETPKDADTKTEEPKA